MKHQFGHRIHAFSMGVLVTLLLINLATPALAAAGKTIEVLTGVKIFIDDTQLNPKDAAGRPVDVFIYNGTTYLPARAISEALGKPVQWEGKTQSVYIGKHSSDTPAAYLSQMDYFTRSNNARWQLDKITKDNLGNDHSHSIERDSASDVSITYKLNGQYARLTAVYYQKYDYRNDDDHNGNMLVIYGDGHELWHGYAGPGLDPVNIDIDITGVLELKIEYPGFRFGYTALGDVALWT